MPQNTSDSAAFKALSKPFDQKLLSKARTAIKTEEVSKAFQALHVFYASKRTDTPPVDCLETLVKFRMTGVAEYVFLKSASELRSLSINELLRVGASAKCISAWIGKGEDSAAREAALLARFKESPSESLSSALAMWFFEYAPPKLFSGGLDAFLLCSDPRPFTPTDTLLHAAMSRDRDGNFLSALISACARNPGARDRITNEIKYNDALIELFIAGVPKTVQTVDADSITFFINSVFAEMLVAKRPDRKRWWSAKMLSLTAGIVSHSPCEVSNVVLNELDRLSLLVEEQLLSGGVDSDTCVIRYHGVSRNSVRPRLSQEAAELIALTLVKIQNGDDPRLSLEATAFNLGMKRIAEPGSIVEFIPKCHEDMVGGTSPGINAIVVAGGWKYEGNLIERAKVKPI